MSGTAEDQAEALAIGLRDLKVNGQSIRQAAVSSTVAGRNPFRCPVCQCDTVAVEGQFRREFEEEFQKGESQGCKLAPELEKNVLAISCPQCKIRYVIEPDEMFALREQVAKLHMAAAEKEWLANVVLGNDLVN